MATSLPQISPIVVQAITDMLIAQRGMKRPPEKAAKLLALIVELHRRRRPFPPRDEVAAAIGASIATVDAALSTRLDEGYITLDVETPHGNVRRRNSVIRARYYIPSRQLLETVEAAEQREEQHKITLKHLNLKRAIARDPRAPLLQPVYDQWRAEQPVVTREALIELANRLKSALSGPVPAQNP